MLRSIVILVNLLIGAYPAKAASDAILTNSVRFENPPSWLTERAVEGATRPVQEFLEWDLRRVRAFWHADAAQFENLHGMGPTIQGFFRHSDATIHLGPQVSEKNFPNVFAHELVHAIFFQKHNAKREAPAIPAWLEEGLANHLGKTGPVNYEWLKTQPVVDVTTLSHPSKQTLGLRFHYQTSQALAEMLLARCNLHDLIQLSVGRKLETYLKTYCEIADVNAAYRDWLATRKSSIPETKKQNPRTAPAKAR